MSKVREFFKVAGVALGALVTFGGLVAGNVYVDGVAILVGLGIMLASLSLSNEG